MDYRSTG